MSTRHAYFLSNRAHKRANARYDIAMGTNRAEMSSFGLRVGKAICAEIGMRHMSGRELARGIGRGETYVRERIVYKKEWSLNDLEKICRLWHTSPEALLNRYRE
nr:MAG TPA: helix-turn-helix domain protein [Caudoviricetes sp.]